MNFQAEIFRIVKKIPRGKVASYGQVARVIGKSRSARAVGNALNKNPVKFPLRKNNRAGCDKAAPCHRVVRSDGRVGGYAWGVKAKIAILRREGIELKKGKIPKEFFYKFKI